MSGELNGTKVIISDSVGELVGQSEATISYGGTPIDISNKSYNDWVTYLDGELAAKQTVVSGTFIYNDDTQFELLRSNSWTGTQAEYTVTFALTGETISGTFFFKIESDSAPMGDKVTSAFTMSSSGEPDRTPPTVAEGDL